VDAPKELYSDNYVPEGGLSSLWEIILHASLTVRNSGNHPGAEVVQLYIGIPGGPLKQLRGFEKKYCEVGEAKKFAFALNRRDLSVWTPGGWILQRGVYHIYAGKSVLDIQLSTSITI
jgi:beta-glucosidase